jgi:predicted acyltransferase
VIDVRGWRRWSTPFVAFGRNPLAAYFLSIGLDSVLTRSTLYAPCDASLKWELYWRVFGSWAASCCDAELASLLYALAYVALWAIVMMVMYRKRVFVGI